MRWMPYIVMAGALIATLAFAIIGGGWFWLAPLLAWPIVIAYGLWDRRARQREGRGERLAAK